MSQSGLLELAYWVPLAPLIAAGVIFFFHRWLGQGGAWVGICALLYASVHAILIVTGIFSGTVTLSQPGLQGRFFEQSVTWFSSGAFDFQLGMLIDGLSATMMVVVTVVSLLVQIYSVAYMHGHPRFGLYFAFINLFTFAMLLLVVANNVLQFFVGWELVGLCSYLLIGFDFQKETAAYAGRKAFLTTKLADLGLLIGLLLIFNVLGTFNIPLLAQNVAAGHHAGWILTAVPLLMFLGAAGKSAQVPFHVWLPDAMEGPTPVSALIHAATMVAAGVFLVARFFFLFEVAPSAMAVVAWTGAATALLAASMALVASDIKRVLAFSTVSQLGFMMAALGCGGYTAGVYHLVTHAGFKALLFLCAGSVIHAMHTNDMWKMGGLMTKMPVTAFCYLVGAFAITGLPYLAAGFYSKEEIFFAVYRGNPAVFAVLAVAAVMTSFYMFRSWFLVFSGVPRERDRFHAAHEASPWMTIPMLALVVPSLLGGLLLYENALYGLVQWGGVGPVHHAKVLILVVSVAAFSGGFAGAFWMYASKQPWHDAAAARMGGLTRLLVRRYGFDEAYLWVIARLYYPFAERCARFDFGFIDQRVVDGVGRWGVRFARASRLLDDGVVDHVLVDGQARQISRMGFALRRLQTGLAQTYLFWTALGLGAMLAWIVGQFYSG